MFDSDMDFVASGYKQEITDLKRQLAAIQRVANEIYREYFDPLDMDDVDVKALIPDIAKKGLEFKTQLAASQAENAKLKARCGPYQDCSECYEDSL